MENLRLQPITAGHFQTPPNLQKACSNQGEKTSRTCFKTQRTWMFPHEAAETKNFVYGKKMKQNLKLTCDGASSAASRLLGLSAN